MVDALGPDLVAEASGAERADERRPVRCHVTATPSRPRSVALATPANVVTVTALLVSPLLFAMITLDGPRASWSACRSGSCSGQHRRHRRLDRPPSRHHPAGAFLDPLADKVLVLGAMFALVRMACSRSCRWRSSPSGDRHQPLPHARAGQGSACPRAAGQGQDVRPAARRRARALAADGGRRHVDVACRAVGRRGLTVVTGIHYFVAAGQLRTEARLRRDDA